MNNTSQIISEEGTETVLRQSLGGPLIPERITHLVEIDDGKIICPGCHLELTVKQHSSEGASYFKNKTRIGGQHKAILFWWYCSPFKNIALSKNELYKLFHKNTRDQINFNPFGARISELVSIKLILKIPVTDAKNQQTTHYKLNISKVHDIMMNQWKLIKQ